jgi:hypothetical protein
MEKMKEEKENEEDDKECEKGNEEERDKKAMKEVGGGYIPNLGPDFADCAKNID